MPSPRLMTVTALTATALAIGGVGVAHGAESSSRQALTAVGPTIDRPWLGYGLNVEPEPGGGSAPGIYTDAMAALDSTRIADIQPQIVRDTWLTTGFSPTSTVGSYDWTTTWATNEFKQLDALKAQNVPVMVGWWSTPWDATSTDHATAVADFLQYLIQTKGYTNITAWDGINEANHRDPTTYARWKTEVANISAAVTSRGLSVDILGPAVQDTSAITSWLTSASQEMQSTLDGYDFHYYPTDATTISGGNVAPWALNLTNTLDSNDPSKKPVYAEEVGWKYGWDSANDAQPHVMDYSYGLNMAAMGIQLARGGVSAPIAWRLADLGSPKVWGMYNGASGDTALRPWSYSWTLLTKAFPRTVKLYKPVQPTAVYEMLGTLGTGASQKWSVAAVNMTSSASTQTFTLPGSANKAFSLYTYDNGTRAVDAHGLPATSRTVTAAADGTVSITAPANAMVVVTNIGN